MRETRAVPASSRDHYRFTGEFHYFRVPRSAWHDRLAAVRDLGFEGVSIYVPWNWHQPTPTALDLRGRTLPERDLLGALDAIAAARLTCTFRPGPFITGEWRDGGIPAWLWQRDPSIVALDANGRSAAAGQAYPALTYAHPGYQVPATAWLTTSIRAVADYLASRGGPIVHLQLDDESSWWQQLPDPMALDYNPYLVASREGGASRYAEWLLRRHGSLDAVNAAHLTAAAMPGAVEPPRHPLQERADLPRYLDWLDYKLDVINEHIAVLHGTAMDAGFDGPISMLFPYLQPYQAAKFAAFARQRMPDLELTNECYVSLFSATQSTEQKVAHVIATHEAYHMWRGPGQGPAFSMELQGSNSSFISPGAMEQLYAVTLARAVRGFNIYMLVGGENPPGFELGTGRDYDIGAPIGLRGEVRPHAHVLARHIRVIHAIEPELLTAEPLRDTWLACYAPYESAALAGGTGGYRDAAAAMSGMFSAGELGLSNSSSLTALLTLAGVSWGMLDLERSDDAAWRAARQLWVPCLGFMSADVQQRLLGWMERGGHAIFTPVLPLVDEATRRCDILAGAILGGDPRPAFPDVVPQPISWQQVRTAADGALVVPGEVALFELPPDAVAIAWAEDGSVVGFRRPIGAGAATVLGFRLHYQPVGGADQLSFAAGLVEAEVGPRAASADAAPAVALELAGPDGGMLCVTNPVELPVSTRVTYTPPGTTQRSTLPVRLPGIRFGGRGARLLPSGIGLGSGRRLRYATAELVERRTVADGTVQLGFAAAVGETFEVALEGRVGEVSVSGGTLAQEPHDQEPHDQYGAVTLVIEVTAPEVALSIAPA